MRKWFRKGVYLSVALHVSLVYAGIYEDFFTYVKRNDAQAVTALLERGFDPNTRNPQGQVALIMALQAENLAVAEAVFVRPDTQVGLLNAFGESALMMAALRGHIDWCRRLLERGAPVNKPGWSPLHYAATGPDPKIVELLLDRGAKVDAESPNRTTPLMMAARYGSEDSVKALLAHGADRKRTNDLNITAADYARGAGRDSLAALLAAPGN